MLMLPARFPRPIARLCLGAAALSATLAQPVLAHVARRVAARQPRLFDRLGPHQATDYIIDPVELPFALHLRPAPSALLLRAIPRDRLPPGATTIRDRFLLLLQLLDSGEDGDAAFFSRDLTITGSTEAVVRLRNALDDMDGSVAEEIAEMLGPPGRAVLSQLRRRYAPHAKGPALS